MLEIFQYDFMVRALVAGLAIAIIAPLIGTFLVMRKLSLFADSLAHVALAGVAIGLLINVYPVVTAVLACVLAAIAIERLRSGRKIYGDAALSLFLSGSLAIALALISLAKGYNINLLNYLFGSITAVSEMDVFIILGLAFVVMAVLLVIHRQLFFISFDEESAKVSGLPVWQLNFILMIISAVTVALAMRIVGILLVGALMIVPVLAAMQIANSFRRVMFFSLLFSVISVVGGLMFSFFVNIIAGAAIVLVALSVFLLAMIFGMWRKAL